MLAQASAESRKWQVVRVTGGGLWCRFCIVHSAECSTHTVIRIDWIDNAAYYGSCMAPVVNGVTTPCKRLHDSRIAPD